MTRVLVVEDNHLNMELMVDLLTAEGYDVLKAFDGDAAIQLARDEMPDLILMDIALPNKNGFEAAKTIKSDEATHDIPILAVSASAHSVNEDVVAKYGCDGFLSKPFEFDDFREKVRELLETDK